MNAKEFDGKTYRIVFGSNVIKNGVYLELTDVSSSKEEQVAEMFYYDELGKVVFTAFVEEIPYAVILWLMDAVREEGWPIEGQTMR